MTKAVERSRFSRSVFYAYKIWFTAIAAIAQDASCKRKRRGTQEAFYRMSKLVRIGYVPVVRSMSTLCFEKRVRVIYDGTELVINIVQ